MRKTKEQNIGKKIKKLEKHLNKKVGGRLVFALSDWFAIATLKELKKQ